MKKKERSAQRVQQGAWEKKLEFLDEKIEKLVIELEEMASTLEFRWDENMTHLSSSSSGLGDEVGL